MRKSNYDKKPFISMASKDSNECWRTWEVIGKRISEEIELKNAGRVKYVVVIECYSGVHENEIQTELTKYLRPALLISSNKAFRSPSEIDRLVEPELGGEDPIFGRLTHLGIDPFLDAQKIESYRAQIESIKSGLILLIGTASIRIVPQPDLFIFADMPRWEGQLRQRRNEVDNLGVQNRSLKASLQYKRSFFIDWRVGDKLKQETLARWDYFLDTTIPLDPKMISGKALRAGLQKATQQPIRLVPFFDPGPWGGQWMKEVCDLPDGPPNYAWCFDCVPEENSLLLRFGKIDVEIPAMNLVYSQPQALLGEAVYGRFGAEFPIRFDFLDTMEGGNLSFQVHPLVDYAREHFGLRYTQDESYYILDAKSDAVVYLGSKTGISPEAMIEDLEKAARGEKIFDHQQFAASFPAKKHDHFLIPAGTLHCSGANAMVLEISATPYIFTFKLWDWNRLGLDGLPRPLNVDRGKKVIQWDRDEDYARKHLINTVVLIAEGEGWREERTGLHPAEFIETRRHWFSLPVTHHRTTSVEVLNLIEGSAAIIESPTNTFEPFEIHYAETFVLPHQAGDYRIRPKTPREPCATLKAYVRDISSDRL